MGVLAWLKRRSKEKEKRARIITTLVSNKVKVPEAKKLAPLVLKGELTIGEAVELSRRMREERLRLVEEKVMKGLEKRYKEEEFRIDRKKILEGIAKIQKNLEQGFTIGTVPTGSCGARGSHGGGMSVVNLGVFGPGYTGGFTSPASSVRRRKKRRGRRTRQESTAGSGMVNLGRFAPW